MSGLKRLRESPGRLRYLEPHDLKRLLEVCQEQPSLWIIVQIAINTGMRRSEILSLTRTIQQLLGHKDPRMTSRYSHLSDEFLQHAVNALDHVYRKSEDEADNRGVVREKDGYYMDTTAA